MQMLVAFLPLALTMFPAVILIAGAVDKGRWPSKLLKTLVAFALLFAALFFTVAIILADSHLEGAKALETSLQSTSELHAVEGLVDDDASAFLAYMQNYATQQKDLSSCDATLASVKALAPHQPMELVEQISTSPVVADFQALCVNHASVAKSRALFENPQDSSFMNRVRGWGMGYVLFAKRMQARFAPTA